MCYGRKKLVIFFMRCPKFLGSHTIHTSIHTLRDCFGEVIVWSRRSSLIEKSQAAKVKHQRTAMARLLGILIALSATAAALVPSWQQQLDRVFLDIDMKPRTRSRTLFKVIERREEI